MTKPLIHKYVQENEAGKSAWAILCSPGVLNNKTRDNDWKLENASYFWKNVGCAQCLRLRDFTGKDTYVRKYLEFMKKTGENDG